MLAEGRVAPVIGARVALDDVAAGLRLLADRKVHGKGPSCFPCSAPA